MEARDLSEACTTNIGEMDGGKNAFKCFIYLSDSWEQMPIKTKDKQANDNPSNTYREPLIILPLRRLYSSS